MTYYEVIRGLREDADKTQTDIANLLGTSTQYYQKYEKGIHPLPIHHLKTLCAFYGVSADYILGLPKGLSWPKH